MMRRRVRFCRSSSSRSAGGRPPSVGMAVVRPIVAGTAWVTPTAAAVTEVTPGSPASTGRPFGEAEQVRPRLLRRPVAVVGELGHRLHDHGLERHRHRRVHSRPGQGGYVAHMFEATATGESPVNGGLRTAIS